jgi:hypothetical protein
MSTTDTRDDLLALVAATGIPGTMLSAPSRPLPDEQLDELLAETLPRGDGDGLTGLLLEAVTTGWLPATDAQCDRIEHAHRSALAAAEEVYELLRDVVEGARDRSARVLVLGGLAAATLDHTDPRLRPVRDLHLLFGPDAPMDDIVGRLGFQPSGRHVRPDFARQFSDSVRYRRPDSPDVFVHRTMVDGPYGIRIANERLWQDRVAAEAGGIDVSALSPELRLLDAAFNVVLGRRRSLAVLRDIAQLALSGSYDVDVVRDLAREWDCRAQLAMAVAEAWDTLGIADVLALSRWADRYGPSADELRLLRLYRSDGRGYAARALATMQELPGIRTKLQFAWSLGVPQQSFLDGRSSSRAQWILHGIGELLGGGRRTDEPGPDRDQVDEIAEVAEADAPAAHVPQPQEQTP